LERPPFNGRGFWNQVPLLNEDQCCHTFVQSASLSAAGDRFGLSQNHGGLEYIVVDPGSTDGSRELIKSYGSQIALTIFEPDRGASDGLNKGFARATGDVFGFLNADDLLLPGSLKRIESFFEAHPECDIAMGDGYKIDGQGNRTRHYHAPDSSVRGYFYGSSAWLQQSIFFEQKRTTALPSSISVTEPAGTASCL
jgi:glycosyltransferase involved in cell wall biosynthesis